MKPYLIEKSVCEITAKIEKNKDGKDTIVIKGSDTDKPRSEKLSDLQGSKAFVLSNQKEAMAIANEGSKYPDFVLVLGMLQATTESLNDHLFVPFTSIMINDFRDINFNSKDPNVLAFTDVFFFPRESTSITPENGNFQRISFSK